MKSLPRMSGADDAPEPAGRPLDSIVLPGDLAERVRALLQEWAQSDKLLRYGMTPRNRVLLHGPPGNGKTVLAEAIATELHWPLTMIRYSEIVGTHLGDLPKGITQAFRPARQGRQVLFIDEADSLCRSRRQSHSGADDERNAGVNTLLMEMDRLSPESVVVFATNFADVLDPAMRRRINLTLEMPAPDLDDLRRLLQSLQQRFPLWPIADFDVAASGATSFAACEQSVMDHARRKILDPRFDPLGIAGRPRSAWLREQLAATAAG